MFLLTCQGVKSSEGTITLGDGCEEREAKRSQVANETREFFLHSQTGNLIT